MGAVGAAVLGAPISTAMIIFEMTGDWQTGIAVMTTVSLSSALASRLGAAARARALAEFDEQIVIARTLAVYREVLPGDR